MNIQKNFSLKNYNTFGIDVKTKLFVEIFNEVELKEVLSSQELKEQKKLILGGGSNILLTSDFDGLVLKISFPEIQIISEDEKHVMVEAGAGVIWHELILFCIERNLGGIENLSLIPGTVGAAPMQNIGAYGQELKGVFHSLNGIFIDTLEQKNFFNADCDFGYRNSIFKKELKDKFIITSVTLKLNKQPVLNLEYGTVKSEIEKLALDKITIRDVSKVICDIRKSKLPDPAEIGNAGSFFKNPEIEEEKFIKLKKEFEDIVGFKLGNGKVKVPAGWLIEKCGWKGKKVGNTGVHARQALVLVNYGKASGKEILRLAGEIKESVFQKFRIELKEEVNII